MLGKVDMDPKRPNLREALQPAQEAAGKIREGLGMKPTRPFEISRVSEGGKRHTNAGDPDFATLADAIAWATSASKGNAVRFDIVTRDQGGTWITLKRVFNGQVSDPQV